MHGIGLIGLGRVGRRLFREICARQGMEVRAVCEINPRGMEPGELAQGFAYLLAHDTTCGRLQVELMAKGQGLLCGGREIPLFLDQKPGEIDWAGLGVDILVDATGSRESMKLASRLAPEMVSKVVITHSASSAGVTLVRGVNLDTYDPKRDHVISCSTCTANALAPVLKVIDQAFGVQRGSLATVHPALSGDTMLDAPSHDFTSGRSALGVRPVTSQVAHTTAQLLPHLAGRLMAMSFRVPTLVVDALLADLVLDRPPKEASQVVEVLSQAAQGPLRGIMALEEGFAGRPRVAADFEGDPHSALVDLNWLTLCGPMLRLMIWHDNEYAYCLRVVDVLEEIGKSL